MDVKYLNPVLDAFIGVSEMMNISDINKKGILLKEQMEVNLDVTSVLGLVGEVKGNISFSCSEVTAKKLVSTMMMGAEVDNFDEMARSGVAEFSNMVAGSTATNLANLGFSIDITPPSIITGNDIYFIISKVKTIVVPFSTSLGDFEINIGLEV